MTGLRGCQSGIALLASLPLGWCDLVLFPKYLGNVLLCFLLSFIFSQDPPSEGLRFLSQMHEIVSLECSVRTSTTLENGTEEHVHDWKLIIKLRKLLPLVSSDCKHWSLLFLPNFMSPFCLGSQLISYCHLSLLAPSAAQLCSALNAKQALVLPLFCVCTAARGWHHGAAGSICFSVHLSRADLKLIRLPTSGIEWWSPIWVVLWNWVSPKRPLSFCTKSALLYCSGHAPNFPICFHYF